VSWMMHGDLLVLSVLTGMTSLVGLPWMIGATTRTAAHVRSLLKEEEEEERILEQRVSGLGIHALLGTCVLFATPRQILSQVPLPVLSGVLLYLGFTSLQGLELWDRMQGLFQDQSSISGEKPQPQRRRFTFIQMAAVFGMMKVTKSKWGVLSPLIVALLPLLRSALLKFNIIAPQTMAVLDSNDNEEEEELDTTNNMPTNGEAPKVNNNTSVPS